MTIPGLVETACAEHKATRQESDYVTCLSCRRNWRHTVLAREREEKQQQIDGFMVALRDYVSAAALQDSTTEERASLRQAVCVMVGLPGGLEPDSDFAKWMIQEAE